MIALIFSPFASAEGCPYEFFPPVADTQLLMPADRLPNLLQFESKTEDCPELLADFAQLYFWGIAGLSPDMQRSAHYLVQLRAIAPVHSVLRLLEPAMVLLGESHRYSLHEALRRYQREINSGQPLRRDKALAVINQLAAVGQRVDVSDQKLFLDPQHTTPAAFNGNRAVVLNAEAGLLFAYGHSGGLELLWAKPLPSGKAAFKHVNEYLSFFAAGNDSGLDHRRQQWRMPVQQLHSGIIRSRFMTQRGQRDIHCTATVIASQWLLTAAHCLSPPQDAANGQLSELFFEWQGEKRVVSEIWRHRKHRAAAEGAGEVLAYSGSDLALIKLQVGVNVAEFPQLNSPAATPLQIISYGYPQDKTPGSLWASKCQAKPYLRAENGYGDVYRLNCSNSVGQSGAAILNSAHPQQIFGVLSARVRQGTDDYNVFAAFAPDLVKDVRGLVFGAKDESRYFERLQFNDRHWARNVH